MCNIFIFYFFMDKIVNFFLKSLSFDVFQIVVFNCEISMRILFYEFCNKNVCNFELKVFDCKDEAMEYWLKIIYNRDFIKTNEMLKYSKLSNFIKKLTTKEILEIIYSIYSVNFYETFEYLIDFIELDEIIANRLIFKVFFSLRTPNNKKQQQNQFEIIKKLMKNQTKIKIKDELNINFYFGICSSNIPLADFLINKFDIKINGFFYDLTILQIVVDYLIKNPNINNEFSVEMFDYLLRIGADVNKRNLDGKDIIFYIERIKNPIIRQLFFDKLLQLK